MLPASAAPRRLPYVLSRCSYLALALLAADPIAALLLDPAVGSHIKIEVATVLAVATLWPRAGLLAVAAFVPLGDMLAPLYGSKSVANGEAIVLAFLAVWFAWRGVSDRRHVIFGSRLPAAVSLFAAIVVGSVVATASQLYRASDAEFYATLSGLQHHYLTAPDVVGAHAAANLLEGIAVMSAAAYFVRARRSMPKALASTLVAGGVVGVAGNALLARGIAPALTLARFAAVGLPRYTATVGDVNAAGSWYVLLFGLSLGYVLQNRAPGRLARAGAASGGALVFGMWLTGSRAAFIATGALLSIVAARRIVQSSSARLHRVGLLVFILALITGAVFVGRSAKSGLEMRQGFALASIHMTSARPVFGVGIGRYYTLSELVLPPPLAWAYGRENAHNYYFQLLAEIGVLGLAAFLWMLVELFREPVRRVWRGSADGALLGAVLGGTGFLVTALSGQPFLLAECVFPFWIASGVMAAAAPAAQHRVRIDFASVVVAVVLLLTAPLRRGVPDLHYPDAAGSILPRRHQTGAAAARIDFSVVYVSRDATGVELELRVPLKGGHSTVGIAVPQWSRREVVVGPEWKRVFITMPGAAPLVPKQAIVIESVPPPVELRKVDVVWRR